MNVRFGSVKCFCKPHLACWGELGGRLALVGRRSKILARGVATITFPLAIAPRPASTWCRRLVILGAGRIDSAMASERRFEIWPME